MPNGEARKRDVLQGALDPMILQTLEMSLIIRALPHDEP
jgi:hypothetical protein